MPDDNAGTQMDAHATSVPDQPVFRHAAISAAGAPDIENLLGALGSDPMDLIILMVSPRADFHAVMSRANDLAEGATVMGCTTAGEITGAGYDHDQIVAVGFPKKDFSVEVLFVDDLCNLNAQKLTDKIVQTRVALKEASPGRINGFAFLMVDGLSMREDDLTAVISPALAEFPLFGGSAGDGTDFKRALVGVGDRIGEDAAALALVRSRFEAQVFTLNHLIPENVSMVVTEADPAQRIVKEINAEPAAREYARIVGKNPDQLNPFIFAAHPVVVRIGSEHHVRSIQRVNANGELVFFSAIDEGMVLHVASAEDMTRHLDHQLDALGGGVAPDAIFACDCILRRIEAQQCQQLSSVSEVLSRHNVVGYSTYGEQFGPLHVNQTMTGVAFFEPRALTAK